jgi:hypothetical protein
MDPNDDTLCNVDVANLFNMEVNLLLAFLLIPRARKSPSAIACVLSASIRVFSLAMSGKHFLKISNGMHPY